MKEEYRTSYEADGYLHIPGFYNQEELELLKKYTEEIQTTKEEVGGQMMWFEKSSLDEERILNRVEDFCRRHEGMASFFVGLGNKLVKLLEDLLHDELVIFKDKINFKQPGGDGFKAHQDQAAGWGKYIQWFVSVGIFIDYSTIENGCLQVAPGLHKQGLLGKEWEPIENLDLPYQTVECSPGDIIIFDSYVPHRSARNTSLKQRRAIFLTYNSKKDGDKLDDYYADKRRDFPPDIERPKGKEYVYRV